MPSSAWMSLARDSASSPVGLLISVSSCGPAFGFDVNTSARDARENCKSLLDHVLGIASKFDTVVLAGRWAFQFGVEPSEYGDPKFGVEVMGIS